MPDDPPHPSVTGALVDADHPWLGLHAFTEENQHYFFGRTAEVRELFLRVREHPLTVLYGQSRVGKTSLLRAGLIAKLRIERFRPVRLLLDFAPTTPSLVQQVRAGLAEACHTTDTPAAVWLERWQRLASLWEVCHHESLRPADLAAQPLVLILDQFEEVFTLGEKQARANDPRRAQVRELFFQLADLIEHRPAEALRRELAAHPGRATDYAAGRPQVHVVLALREDHLAHLEAWKMPMLSLGRNRMALHLLKGPQALEAVVKPGRTDGPDLVSNAVGVQIVRLVAQRAPEIPLEDIEVVPPLLSLVCERLNSLRPAQTAISSELVVSQGEDILQRFYAQIFSGREAAGQWGARHPGELTDAEREFVAAGRQGQADLTVAERQEDTTRLAALEPARVAAERPSIASRAVWLSWLVTSATILILVSVIIPMLKCTFVENLEAKAQGVAATLRSTLRDAILHGRWAPLLASFEDMLRDDPSLEYLVIAKNDGMAIFVDRTAHWRATNASLAWRPMKRETTSGIRVVPEIHRRVFHYSRPLDLDGQWGWIHVGLSVRSYDAGVRTAYVRTGLLTLGCIAFALVASLYYSRQLTRPGAHT